MGCEKVKSAGNRAKIGLIELVEALVKKKTLVKLFFLKPPLQILRKLFFIRLADLFGRSFWLDLVFKYITNPDN